MCNSSMCSSRSMCSIRRSMCISSRISRSSICHRSPIMFSQVRMNIVQWAPLRSMAFRILHMEVLQAFMCKACFRNSIQPPPFHFHCPFLVLWFHQRILCWTRRYHHMMVVLFIIMHDPQMNTVSISTPKMVFTMAMFKFQPSMVAIFCGQPLSPQMVSMVIQIFLRYLASIRWLRLCCSQQWISYTWLIIQLVNYHTLSIQYMHPLLTLKIGREHV